MPRLSEIIREVRESPGFERARKMAADDYNLVSDLVALREERGLRQEDVAEALGITQQAVSRIETSERDPRLSTIRMYANAVGAVVRHVVERDEAPSEFDQAYDSQATLLIQADPHTLKVSSKGAWLTETAHAVLEVAPAQPATRPAGGSHIVIIDRPARVNAEFDGAAAGTGWGPRYGTKIERTFRWHETNDLAGAAQ